MRVFIVGTSCTWFKRNNTSFIIDDKVLFDTPTGSYKDIIKRINIFELEGIIISHLHSDHFGDLRTFATRFMRESPERYKENRLKVFCPKGTLEHLIALNKLMFGADDECDENRLQESMEFVEISDNDEFELAGYKVKVFEVDHGKVYSLGFTFTDKNNNTVAFSGDTRDCENLRKMLDSSQTAFVDMASQTPVKNHIDLLSFLELIKAYPYCKIYPVHTCDKNQQYVEEKGLNALHDYDEIII